MDCSKVGKLILTLRKEKGMIFSKCNLVFIKGYNQTFQDNPIHMRRKLFYRIDYNKLIIINCKGIDKRKRS